jgi:hypothetical protein
LSDPGLGGNKWWTKRLVLGGGGQGRGDFEDIGVVDREIARNLDHYEIVMYKLQKCGTSGGEC